jgi:hypothetical protein
MSIPTLRRLAFLSEPTLTGDLCNSFAEIAFRNASRRDSSCGETDNAGHVRIVAGIRLASPPP